MIFYRGSLPKWPKFGTIYIPKAIFFSWNWIHDLLLGNTGIIQFHEKKLPFFILPELFAFNNGSFNKLGKYSIEGQSTNKYDTFVVVSTVSLP